MALGKTHSDSFTVSSRGRFAGTALGLAKAHLSDKQLLAEVRDLLAVKKNLVEELRKIERQLQGVGAIYGDRVGMWGVNETVLRKEVALRLGD